MKLQNSITLGGVEKRFIAAIKANSGHRTIYSHSFGTTASTGILLMFIVVVKVNHDYKTVCRRGFCSNRRLYGLLLIFIAAAAPKRFTRMLI